MALVYALTLASLAGWTALSTLLVFGLSIVMLAGFIFNETKSKHPLVPLEIFRIRNVTGGNLVMLPVVAGALGQFFFLSLYVQNVLHYSPVLSGLCFLPVPIIIGVVSYNIPRFLGKFGFKPLAITGVGLAALGVFIISFLGANSSYWLHMFPAFVILAFGFGISFVAITVAATSGVPADEAGLASGLINTSQQVGGALGLAILAVVATTATTSALHAGVSPDLASVQGYQMAFRTAAGLMFVALLVSVFVIQVPKAR